LRLPLPAPLQIPRIFSFSVSGRGAVNIYEMQEYWNNLWFSNSAIAEAYGLTPDDLEYILSTFPVFARKRPEFYAYLQQCVVEWKEEESKMKPEAKEYPVSEGRQAHAAAESHEPYKKNDPNQKE